MVNVRELNVVRALFTFIFGSPAYSYCYSIHPKPNIDIVSGYNIISIVGHVIVAIIHKNDW